MKKQKSPVKMANLKVTYLSISDLKENSRNARIHSEKQVAKIAKSINKLGFNNPILVDKKNTIVAGHGRFSAAKLLGISEVPTITLEHLNQEELRAYIIADNRLAEEAGWDNDILKIELQDLIVLYPEFDVSLSGFEIPEIDIIINDDFIDTKKSDKTDKADIIPDESKILQKVQLGDLWKLENHYLYCGNSLEEESFKALLGDKKANMVLCDLPYNVKIDGHVCGNGKIKHSEFAMASGEMTSTEFTTFLETSFKYLSKYSTNGTIHFFFMDWRHILEIMIAGDIYTELKNVCVWNKLQGGMGSLYRSQHELIFVFKNGTAPHVNNIELGKHGRYRTNVWDYKGISATNPKSLEDLKLHPTVKPVALLMDAILDCSRPNDIIVDCFAGSGSTLLAAERTHRRAYCIEYEPKYCDVILFRYEKLFKKKAVLVANHGGLK